MSGEGADQRWMARALDLARAAERAGEVPVGAVLVRGDELIAGAWNSPIARSDPTAHAEILALRAAGEREGNYRLPGTTLYVTLEPCPMCAGAMIHARIERLVFGASDPRAGAAGSVYDLLGSTKLNHRCQITAGVLNEPCARILSNFFMNKR